MKKHPCHTSCIALIPQILAIRRSAVRQPIGACEHAPRRNHNTVVRKFSSTVRGSDISCVENKGTNWVVHKPQFLASVLRGFLPSFRRRASGSHGLVSEPHIPSWNHDGFAYCNRGHPQLGKKGHRDRGHPPSSNAAWALRFFASATMPSKVFSVIG